MQSVIPADTVVVISRTASHTDYTPLFSGIAASALVAGMAFYSTWTQRRIADAATTTQRELAKQGVDVQLEIARRTQVVDSRREWVRELRQSVANFEAAAFGITDRSPIGTVHLPPTDEQRLAHRVEMMRLMTTIVLLLDPSKPAHREIVAALNGVAGWSLNESTIMPPAEEDDTALEIEARKFGSGSEAMTALDRAVRRVLEGAWQKIREGA